MNVRYRVDLSQIERTELKPLLGSGKHASRKLKRAQILLAADAVRATSARSVGVGGSTVYRIKRHFVEGNLERALSDEPRPTFQRRRSYLRAQWWSASADTSLRRSSTHNSRARHVGELTEIVLRDPTSLSALRRRSRRTWPSDDLPADVPWLQRIVAKHTLGGYLLRRPRERAQRSN